MLARKNFLEKEFIMFSKRLVFLGILVWGLTMFFPAVTKAMDNQTQEEFAGIQKIVGGKPVEDDSRYPWMVSLNSNSQYPDIYSGHSCGGTLIAPEWVLTAAHCVKSIYMDFHVVLGTTSLVVPPGNYERIGVQRILRHPSYVRTNNDNDIALLQLSAPSSMTPVDGLHYSGDPSAISAVATAIGWGTTEFKGDIPEQLQEVTVPFVSNEVCQQALESEGFTITENMICAGAWEGGKDSCQGDSGGPLFIRQRGRDILTGVVSFGYKCAERAKPGVYARVSMYTDWVRETMETECVFDILEQDFPEYFTRLSFDFISTTLEGEDMRYRSYPLSNSFLGVSEGNLMYSGELTGYSMADIGTVQNWAESVGCQALK